MRQAKRVPMRRMVVRACTWVFATVNWERAKGANPCGTIDRTDPIRDLNSYVKFNGPNGNLLRVCLRCAVDNS